MAAHKKRKLDGNANSNGSGNSSPGPQIVSAFAARQKLLGLGLSSPSPAKSASKSSPKEEPRDQIIVATETPSSAPVTQVLSPPPALPLPHLEPRGETSTFYSSFRPTKKNYQQKTDGRARLIAAEGERIVVLGSYGIKVLDGEITIAGAILSSSDRIHWVHAPHCHALPVLRAADKSTIELRPHPAAHGMRQLSKLNPAFGKLWNEDSSQGIASTGKANKTLTTFQIMFTSEDRPKRSVLQDLVSPAEWNKKLAGLVVANKKSATPIVFLCGPKSSGKSTLGRLLTNRLITDQSDFKKRPWSSVVVLDLDPGQPEYGPPGVISVNKISVPVLSLPFCHPAAIGPTHTQLRAHAIASVSPALDPDHFVECALDLFSHYKGSAHSRSPLIINTPGWIQGTGLDILSELVKTIAPTEVVYMSQDGPEETVNSLKAACAPAQIPFHTLPSQTSENGPRTSLHLRMLQTMSYFHLNLSSPPANTPPPEQLTWNPTPLTEMRPWRVRYRGPSRGFVGVLCYDHQPAPDLLGEAMNGMILALVKVESNAAFRDLLHASRSAEKMKTADSPSSDDNEKGINWTSEGIPLIQNAQGRTLDPRHSRALGLVLVRGIDTKQGELQLLTPLPVADVIAAEDGKEGSGLVLVAGKFDTPSWAYAEDLYWRTSSSSSGSRGGSAAAVEPSSSAEEDGSDEGEGMMGVETSSESDDSDEADEDGEKLKRQEGAKQSVAESLPWVEMLHGSQKRSVGSRVWRVRRDLGRS
ncbi:hypothetical protein B0H66DRAFT_552134 [Apodospora peruviana]|uniref:Polynucleotide 5'-hydroxyl-kinase GRC3 n=1 Tax=Apodospora peruviana TaxID=516989 RepID=A0AAE0IAJ8_9PEZI|nr:hypothetical protein B0H66DRAFT_552134 [Apodospora peruviana]